MSMCPAISAKGNNGYVETIYLCAWYDCNECPSNRQSWFLAKVAVSGNNNTFFLHMSYLVSQITNYKLLTFFFPPFLPSLDMREILHLWSPVMKVQNENAH